MSNEEKGQSELTSNEVSGKEDKSSPKQQSTTQQLDKNSEDLASEEEEQRNWRGIIISLLVIATVCSLIITSVVILSPGEAEPRVKNPRFTLEEVISGAFDPRLFNGTWLSGKEIAFRYADGAIVVYDAETKEKTTLMPNSSFIQSDAQAFSISPNREFILLSYDHEQIFTHSYTAKYKMYIVSTNLLQPLLPDMPNAVFQYVEWGKKDSQLVYVYQNNIYYMEKYDVSEKPKALTKTGEKGVIFNGIPDWVYEAEVFQTNKALWWSDDGTKLAFACFNDSEVNVMTYPWYGSYEESTNVYPQTITLRYPKPGKPNPRVILSIVDLVQPFPITTEVVPPKELASEDHYLTAVQWIGEKKIMTMWLKRAQNSSIVSICNEENGWMCVKHIQEDASYGWVEMKDQPLFTEDRENYFLRLPIPDGKAGYYRHVVMLDLKNERKDFLTHGRYDVTQILAHRQDLNTVYFMTTLHGLPGQRHLYTVKDSKAKNPREQHCLTCDQDENCLYHNVIFSSDNRYFILECLGPGVPKIELRKSEDNELVNVLDTNDDLQAALEERALPQIQTFQVPLKGKYDANVRLYLPPGLREEEIIKFPLILHVCGAPGTQLVDEKFNINWGTYLASHKNFIYAYIDGRGSGFEGDNRVHEVYKRLGTMEVEDQIAVTSYLIENNQFIDGDRIALWGWGYGGYMTVSALAADNDIFACGISVAPITNWLYYDSVYSERYMTSPKPEDNYIGYEKSDASIKAEHIKGKKFLLIHGTADDDVHFQHSMMLIKALTHAGVLFRTQVYPDERHSLHNVKTHLYQTMEDFLDFNCYKPHEDPESEASR